MVLKCIRNTTNTVVWVINRQYVDEMLDYETGVSKTMYTTNAIEAINSSARKVTKKGAFPNEIA
jgi:transposase-like protein